MPLETKIEQWAKEIARITADVTDTIESQFIFKRLGEIVGANPKISADNLFWDHLAASFGADLVLGITRQVDTRTEVVSLLKLLEDLRDNPGVITKEWYGDQYEKNSLNRAFGVRSFEEHFGLKPELDPTLIEKDIQDLKSITAKVAKFRHTRVAHKNVDEHLVIDLNFVEVEEALKFIETVVIKYQLLLNQSGYTELMPTITYNWESVFRTPWIE
ncbi:MAG: AbiU2 domain-containing protein [Minisyncoccota bacterium]